MNRFHVNVGVADLDKSLQFYETLFGVAPSLVRPDYAKWMLDDPRVNFSISRSGRRGGVNHLGIQAETTEDLGEIQARLSRAGAETLDQPDAECCYAKSAKTWVSDPDGVSWETFVTFGEITRYGEDREPEADTCCGPSATERCCVA